MVLTSTILITAALFRHVFILALYKCESRPESCQCERAGQMREEDLKLKDD